MKKKTAIQKINEHGVLLVFPINNKKEPHSLWSALYPRSPMKWVWDEDGDDRVMKMWAMMKELSASQEVVYSKWYQGRATFFSKELFTALLRMNLDFIQEPKLSYQAGIILELLENDSPLSTKQIKRMAELQGKDNEKFYTKALKELFNNFLIVAYGEVDDGAFPSLAVGATKHLFEDLVQKAQGMSEAQAQKIISQYMSDESLVRKFYKKTRTYP